jgi:signal peptidase I
MDLSVFYLKRCVALPGDTLSIESGIYKVKNFQDSLGYLFRQQKLSKKSQDDFSSDIWNCFPFDSLHFQWNIKDFGPLFVPFSGATLVLDTLNLHLYKNLIEYETDKPLFLSKGSIYSGDKEIDAYTFKLNYYFMAGDNIFDSKDSRYWGLLPEDCIIGKAILVWRSTDMQNGKIRLDRFFKVIK